MKAWRWSCLAINITVLVIKYTRYEDMNVKTYKAVEELMHFIKIQKSANIHSTLPISAGKVVMYVVINNVCDSCFTSFAFIIVFTC